MEKIWRAQKAQPGYKELAARVPILGIYDDHDFGINNGGGSYADKYVAFCFTPLVPLLTCALALCRKEPHTAATAGLSG